MKRISRFLLILCATIMLASYPVLVSAASATPIESFEYTLTGPGTVLLTKYTGENSIVTIPGSYLLDGVSYQVALASQTVFAGNADVTSVTVSSGVAFEELSMAKLFAKCTGLRTVKINTDTSKVTDMSYLFYGCEALEKLDLSGLNTACVTTMKGMFSNCSKLEKLTGYEDWDTQSLLSIAYMFNQTEKMRKVDLSRWSLKNLQNSGWCFQKCGASKILLPDDIAVISAGFLNHVTSYAGNSFTVPAGVKKIGYAHTLYDFATNDFKEFRVAEGNEAYKAVDGILYSADGKEMLAIPRGKVFPDKTYAIPEGVSFMGELSFSRNDNVETVILPDTYVLDYVPLNDPAYILYEDTGNLNAGLNLNIAIYRYTGVKFYAVKESNPNYKSIDGVLYTKDGSALVAVPTRYEGLLEIPEGVSVWYPAAMWNAGETIDSLMKNCAGASIPASLTEIAQDQLEKLNRLENRYAAFKITVSEDNPVYYTGKSGQLLKKSNLNDVELKVLQDTFIFDGQPKSPDVAALHKGKTLRPGKDYTVSYFNNINAGTGWVRITGLGDYYGTVEYAFTIEKAKPEYELPNNISAVYGSKLADISLPKGFAWLQPYLPVGDVGTQTYVASYTKDDDNYLELNDIPITVQVKPKKLGTECFAVAPWHPWTGLAITPNVSVIDVTGEVPVGEYTVSYKSNVSIGKGCVILKDAPGGNYKINGSAEFYIVPGPFSCIVLLTLLWSLTTGFALRKGKKDGLSAMQQKNR